MQSIGAEMVGRCCIVACANNASECEERVSFFKVPTEADLFDKWVLAVEPTGSTLHEDSILCERHFREDQIRRLALVRDSFGNVIFQRPLIKVSLIKDAVPSIFHYNIKATSGKNRQTSSLEQENALKIVGGFPEDNSNVDFSNIVVSFHEDQTSSIQYVTNASQSPPLNSNGVAALSSFAVEGTQPTFSNDDCDRGSPGNGQIQIQNYISPRGFDGKAVNNVENSSGDKTAESIDSLLANKQQLQRIPKPNASNAEMPKHAGTNIADDEVMYLNQINNINYPQRQQQRQKKINPAKRPKKASQSPLQQSEKDMNLRSFNLIYQNSDKIKLPNSTWGYHKNDKDNDIMVFSKVRWFSTNACTLPLYERQVVFHESNELKIYINNVFSPLEASRPRSIAEMEAVLMDVDKLSLCSGGPSIEFAQTAALAQKDHAVGRWRHKYCPIVVANDENICKYCSSINQVFRYPKQKRLPFGRRPHAQAQKQQAKRNNCSSFLEYL